MRYQNKIRVFISSKCKVEPFDTVRKMLKQRIDHTGFAHAFLYEGDSASSLPNQSTYLYELDDCNVCIFLIDSSMEIPEGVLKEINRAKAKDKKSLYVFRRLESEPKMELQNDLEKVGNLKYCEVDSFDDFPEEAYWALLNDVTKVYAAYCRHEFEDATDVSQDKELEEIVTNFSEVLGRQIIQNIDLTKRSLYSEVIEDVSFYPSRLKNETSNSELDQFFLEFLPVLLKGKSIRNFNVSLLLDTIKKQQSDKLHSVVITRWKAIQAYFSDDLEACVGYLKNALTAARADGLPEWIINDILIDVRNRENELSAKNNVGRSDQAQLELQNSKQVLYYPLIDRFAKEFYDKIDSDYTKDTIKSPYTVEMGNSIDRYTDMIASIMAVAIFNGSLTHLLLLWNYFYDFGAYLCSKYSDWTDRVLLLKNAFIVESSKNAGLILSTFNDTIGKMNAADAMCIFEYTYNLPIKYKRFAAQLKVLAHLGYYFSDSDYKKITQDLITAINMFWENPFGYDAPLIFEFFSKNNLRLDNNHIADSCTKVFDKRYKNVFRDMLNTLSIIDYDGITKEKASTLITVISELMRDPDNRSNYSNELEKLIVYLKRRYPKYYQDIASLVETIMPEFFRERCLLEENDRSVADSISFIQKHIGFIKVENDTQGKNGSYHELGINPYGTIKNILMERKIELPLDIIKTIVEVTTNTILLDRQTMKNKDSAFRLLIFLRTYTLGNLQLDSLFENSSMRMSQNEHSVFEGNDGFHDQFTPNSMKTHWLLFRITCNQATNFELIKTLAAINTFSVFEKINAMKAISLLFDNDYVYVISNEALGLFTQFVLGYCSDATHDLRFFAIEALSKMITESNQELVASQLYASMDFDNSYIKSLILRRLPKMNQLPNKSKEYIISKAKADNHFYIRRQANEMKPSKS